MKQNSSKLKQQEEHRTEVQHSAAHQQTVREFATVEELLRYDAAQVSSPPEVAKRLGRSVAGESKPNRSWWQRFFGS